MGFFGKLFGSERKKQDFGTEHQSAPSISKMEPRGSMSTSTMAKDPVCGMDVDVNTSAAKSDYQGQTYYFCAPACKVQFDKDPAKYANGTATGGQNQKRSCC
jgi:YHS domain-containing protein